MPARLEAQAYICDAAHHQAPAPKHRQGIEEGTVHKPQAWCKATRASHAVVFQGASAEAAVVSDAITQQSICTAPRRSSLTVACSICDWSPAVGMQSTCDASHFAPRVSLSILNAIRLLRHAWLKPSRV